MEIHFSVDNKDTFYHFSDRKRARLPGGLHKPFDAHRDEHFHRQPRRGRLLCDIAVLAADGRLGRHRDVVPRRNAVQSSHLLSG